MSQSEKFLEAVAHYCEGLTVAPGPAMDCLDCLPYDDTIYASEEDWYESASEGSFSWSQCDSCGSTLGGSRFDAHGITEEKDIIHLDICTDCLCYHANGDIPEIWE